MPVFYTKQVDGRYAILEEDESRHLIRVLRLKQKDTVDLVDGKGNLFKGIVSIPDPRCTRIEILETIRDHLARSYYLHLAIAPTKSTERFEWFLEKATEIGVDEITPILCERSERQYIRQERSGKILLTARKQSGRAYLPKLNPVVPLSGFLQEAKADMKFIAHCRTKPGAVPENSGAPYSSWLVLIGPEGDFTPEEVALATAMHYREISLGEAVYRTETAGVMACQLINFLNPGK